MQCLTKQIIHLREWGGGGGVNSNYENSNNRYPTKVGLLVLFFTRVKRSSLEPTRMQLRSLLVLLKLLSLQHRLKDKQSYLALANMAPIPQSFQTGDYFSVTFNNLHNLTL